MKKTTLISISVLLLTNIILSQDIINETGKDGKFIVRDAEQQEAMVIEDGNVGITGELKIETMPEGSNVDGMVVWDRNDKSLKVVPRVFSRISPLSKPLLTEGAESVVIRGNASDEYGISPSVLGIQALDAYDEIRITNTLSTDGVVGTAHLSYRGSSGAEYGWMGDGSSGSPDMILFATTGNSILRSYAVGKSTQLWDNTGQVVTVKGGNVGIGTADPIEKLVVNSGSNSSSSILFQNDITGTTATDGLKVGFNGCTTDIWNYENSRMRFGNNVTEMMTLNANGTVGMFGDVGIGTSNPVVRLHVYDNATNEGAILFQNSTTGLTALGSAIEDGLFIGYSGSNAFLWNYEDTDINFGTNASTDFTIKSGGQVGIGTDSPNYKLDVETEASIVSRFTNTSTNTSADGIRIVLTPTIPSTNAHYIDFTDTGESSWAGWVGANGSGGCLYNTTSDARLKMNIVDSPSALEKVSKIRVRQYEKKTAPGIELIGFLAQELQEIYPQAVSGNPEDDIKESPMGIDYGRITPLLVKAIQELQARIEVLEGR